MCVSLWTITVHILWANAPCRRRNTLGREGSAVPSQEDAAERFLELWDVLWVKIRVAGSESGPPAPVSVRVFGVETSAVDWPATNGAVGARRYQRGTVG